jgi:hypothetical protein
MRDLVVLTLVSLDGVMQAPVAKGKIPQVASILKDGQYLTSMKWWAMKCPNKWGNLSTCCWAERLMKSLPRIGPIVIVLLMKPENM